MSSLASIVQTLSILCCITLIIALLPSVYSGELFPWHPVLMAVGFLGFMCEGIVTAYKLRPTDGPSRIIALQQHMNIQLTATACILFGFAAIYANKNLRNKEHFTSLHGKVGVIATALACVSPILGALGFRRLGLLERFPKEWQAAVKWTHRLLGATTWTLALVAMQLDLPHSAVLEGIPCRAWQAAALALGIGVLLMLRRPAPGKPALPMINQAMVPQEFAAGPKHL